ncbi:kinase-like domain-containing protein [Neohortaea acidophila]|uniref:Kinase-like domain-containing protein n=1 Tax=Neohortaea acidophila TaxID=245834 RepID=A0A6A6Q522_9PEZI|nr:kinase-like domain-containing protein [Neohortaea acidophila]KAF2487470.1 kinase-like domain-containing protein [Neohortaea acidophila]
MPDTGVAELDFASLTAANPRAVRGMQSVLEVIYDQASHNLEHQRKFIRGQAGALAATRSPAFTPDPDQSSSGFTTEADLSDDEEYSFDGAPCYVLSLEEGVGPLNPQLGWWFGTGDLVRYPESGGVDLLLPPHASEHQSHLLSESPSTTNLVYARQGYFAFDSKYGRLWLHARHKGIRVEDRPLAPRSKILLESRARISIGPFRFIFEFKVSDEASFQRAKKRALTEYYGQEKRYEATSATPSTHDVRIENWILHGVVGASAVSLVHAASHVRSGEVVAVKRLRLSTKEGDVATKELQVYDEILASIREHRYSKFVMQKHSVLAHDRPPTPYREVYLLWKPLALGDFAEFRPKGRWRVEFETVKKRLFVQTLLGLSALHDCGWIHRDLKPTNLGVVELGERPFAIIMDEGQAICQTSDGHKPRVGHCGTVGYLAPELENGAFASTYGKEVDIWSMGVVAYFLLVGKITWSCEYNMFVPERDAQGPSLWKFREARARLMCRPEDSVEHLIGGMMEEDPRRRLSMPEILAHPALRDVRKAVDDRSDTERQVGQKRGHDALHAGVA